MTDAAFCAIDFGTSNSAIAVPAAAPPGSMALVPLEGDAPTMPTAVFYFAEGDDDAHGLPRAFGRAALAAYVDGHDGRLMRSMKSILGSDLLERDTEVAPGRRVKYADVVAGYLRRLKATAERELGTPIRRAVLGRPVFFVDDDAARDAQAQRALDAAARAVGFDEVTFQYEPIAAAFDFERRVDRERLVLVADIGGGTSDFSLVRVGPSRRGRVDRSDDILGHHGVHVAGTDFDRRTALAGPMRALGFGAFGPPRVGRDGRPEAPREVASGIYFDLATWHLINGCYAPAVRAEVARRRGDYADPTLHRRLTTVLDAHLGHDLAARAEAGKIALGSARDDAAMHPFDLSRVEPGLAWPFDAGALERALAPDLARIVAAASDTVRQAGVAASAVDALYFTGGSTGLARLVDALGAAFPTAERIHGDPLASVAHGLGVHARRVFGAPPAAPPLA